MSQDHSHRSDTAPGTKRDSETETVRDEIQWLSEVESNDEGPSLVDPLSYAPLMLVGTVLIFFPEPATTAIGFLCLFAGLLLAAVDARSSDDSP
ncbi:hypothetical protein halTADL_2972 [Halohasta litchfieldiae]|uniref:Uncharacterized protein n=1 Tax=Halohasta litchfieldiae TaxID=1073996 RepID=A0A1H6RFB4_9EURY|nr:hypothetical protein [Halohasta litchfieldiae]ATW89675.1 hypothetical protein halTADL_2972 [Halohasta litchfieldiae]SEI54433.1 hypothetical protein SAMN05444271_102158 [Halohasta litchfieldiae]